MNTLWMKALPIVFQWHGIIAIAITLSSGIPQNTLPVLNIYIYWIQSTQRLVERACLVRVQNT